MIRRNTMILVLVFAVLLAATLFWQRTKSRDDALQADNEPVEVDPSIVDIGSASVVAITLQDAERKTVKLVLDESGEWSLVIPTGPADSSAVGATLDQLLSLTASSTLSSSTALADLGLSPPEASVVLDLDDGRQFVLNIGKETPIGSGYYVLSNANDRKIYVANKYSLDGFLNWLEIPPLLPPTPTPTVEVLPAQENPLETATP